MSQYAQNTSVPVEKSRSEIEMTLRKYGCDTFMSGWNTEKAFIEFQCEGKRLRFVLPMPDPESNEFRFTPKRRVRRSRDAQMEAYEQGCRQRWRALALAIKAKLECVETGITDFETEFMPHIVLPNGQTASQYMLPQIEEAYATGVMPPMLPLLETRVDES